MKKRIVAALFIFIVTCVMLFIVSNMDKNAPIKIKTELNDSEVLPEVELSRGKLYFQQYSEILDGLTAEERREARLAGLELMDAESISVIKIVGQEELEQAMNIYPEYWNICGKIGEEPYSAELEVPLDIKVWKEQNKVGLRNIAGSGTVLAYRFYKDYSDGSPYIFVEAGAADAELLNRHAELGLNAIKTIREVYGHKGSLIGDVPLTISYRKLPKSQMDLLGERVVHMYAEMVLGETRYMVESIGFTQREFIDFLISVYEAPRPEKRDIVTYILDNNSEIKEEVENILNGNT